MKTFCRLEVLFPDKDPSGIATVMLEDDRGWVNTKSVNMKLTDEEKKILYQIYERAIKMVG